MINIIIIVVFGILSRVMSIPGVEIPLEMSWKTA